MSPKNSKILPHHLLFILAPFSEISESLMGAVERGIAKNIVDSILRNYRQNDTKKSKI